MPTPIRVLILEDRVADAELMLYELRRAGFAPDWQRVDSEPDYLAALETKPDLILADWSLPQFSGLRALHLLRERGLDFPFIIMSGSIGEEAAVEAIRQGAADYLLKDRPARLGSAVEHALHEKRLRDEKRQAEQTLYESEQKFRSFIEQSEDATVLIDEQGIIIEWNRGAERIFGRQRADTLGQFLWDIQFQAALPEQKKQLLYEQLKTITLDILKTGQGPWLNHLTEMEFQRSDGAHLTIQTMAFAIPTKMGFRLGSISRDITERKQAEEALRDSELQYRRLFEAAKDGILILDADTGQIVDVNPFLVELLGYSFEEFQGKKVWEVGLFKNIATSKAAFEKLRKKGYSRYEDLPLEAKEGKQIAVEFVSNVYQVDHRRVVQCNIRDITERKRMERAILLMSDTQRQITHLDDLTDIYQLVGQKIQELIESGYVAVTMLDEQTQAMKVVGFYGLGSLYEKLVRTFKVDPSKITYPLKDMSDDELRLFRSGRLEKFEGGLYNMLVRKVPRHICNAIERELNLTSIYTMSFAWQGTHLGGLTLVPKYDISPYKDMIETIVNQAAIAIKRIRSEEALRKSEESLRKAQRVAHVGSWVWYIQTNSLEWSDEMYHIFGIEKETFSGELSEVIARAIHPDDRAAVEQSNLSVARDKKSTPLEYRIIWPDGMVRVVWAEAGELILDQAGNPAILTGVAQDITDRKLAEDALRQRASQLLLINDISRRVASVMNLDELLNTTASLIHESFGYEHVGIFITDKQQEGDLVMTARAGLYASRFHADHRLKLGQGMTGWVALYGKKLLANDVSTEMRFHDPFGDGLIKSELSVPIRAELGNVGVIDIQSRQLDAFSENDVVVMETLADVLAVAIHNARLYQALELHSSVLEQAVKERTEELSRTKDHIETILNSVGEAIIVFGTDSRIHQVNPAFERLTGYSAAEVELHRYDDPQVVMGLSNDIFRQVSKSHDGHDWHGEMQVHRRDGTIFDAAVSLSPVHDAQDKVVALVGAMRDISLLKEVERLKDAFVSNVSHELRTPITSLKLLHHLLEVNPPKQSSYLEQMGRVIDRLNVLIEDLLRLSRLDQGRVEMNIAPVNLNALVTQYATDLTLLAESKQLALIIEASSSQPTVQADGGLLGQVLSVLLTNALNYTPAGGQIVMSTLTSEQEGQVWAGFSVSDTGPGISPEEQQQLFQRFFRGSAGQTSGTPGTGLGLAIAKEIVMRHGGRVEVKSKGISGEGAVFTVWLPVKNKSTGELEEE